MKIRFADWGSTSGQPPHEIDQGLAKGERVINVETVKDAHGFAFARVWIAQDES